MKRIALIAAACVLALSPASAQVPAGEFSFSSVTSGSWRYRAVAGGSEATFVDTTGTARMAISCGRVTRLVTLSRISAAPASSLSLWTSSATRNLGATFDQRSRRVIAQVSSNDALLDAIAFSRGRFALSMPGFPALVLPAGPEIAHVVEDCRA